MTQLIDLDAVTRPDLRFKLNGKEYAAPGELTVEQMLRWIKIQERWLAVTTGAEGADAPQELLAESKSEILALLRERQPTLKDLPLKPSQIGAMFGALFGRYEEDADVDPTQPTPKRVRKPRS